MLKIFNTLTRRKETFIPIHVNTVNLYVCGVTVYDLCHIGHGRTFIAFDIINRYLQYLGFKVNYIRNITDIEDKIICYATKNHETIQHFSEKMIKEMYVDFDKLNILRPHYEPKVTQNIPEIIQLILEIINKKYAYIAINGDVLFSIEKYINYGILSKQNLKKLKINKNIRHNTIKKHPMDFVLWKISKKNEPSWPSPWGAGRPGWHIECSAISKKYLGNHFDIHGGGSDLIFPHHDNEIAQSTCIHPGPYVNIWMHTGMVMMNQQKMSKSLGNYLTIRDILKYFNSETIRYFVMSNHYRSPLNYYIDGMKQAQTSLNHLYFALLDTDITADPIDEKNFTKNFMKAMNNDFNTPEAYSVLFSIAHHINYLKKQNSYFVNGTAATLRKLANILGLLNQNPIDFLQKNDLQHITLKDKIDKLVQQRNNARKNKQWTLADEIRSYLIDQGIILEDTKHGTIWYKN